jgi:hypothetical protein
VILAIHNHYGSENAENDTATGMGMELGSDAFKDLSAVWSSIYICVVYSVPIQHYAVILHTYTPPHPRSPRHPSDYSSHNDTCTLSPPLPRRPIKLHIRIHFQHLHPILLHLPSHLLAPQTLRRTRPFRPQRHAILARIVAFTRFAARFPLNSERVD